MKEFFIDVFEFALAFWKGSLIGFLAVLPLIIVLYFLYFYL